MIPSAELFFFIPLACFVVAWILTAILHKDPLPDFPAFALIWSVTLVIVCLLTLVAPVGVAAAAPAWPLCFWLGIGLGTLHGVVFVPI